MKSYDVIPVIVIVVGLAGLALAMHSCLGLVACEQVCAPGDVVYYEAAENTCKCLTPTKVEVLR